MVAPTGPWQAKAEDGMVYNFTNHTDAETWLGRRESNAGLVLSNDGGKTWQPIASLPYFASIQPGGRLGGSRAGTRTSVSTSIVGTRTAAPVAVSVPRTTGANAVVSQSGPQPAVTSSGPAVSSTGPNSAVTGHSSGAQPADGRVSGSHSATLPPVDDGARRRFVLGIAVRLAVLVAVIAGAIWFYVSVEGEQTIVIPDTPAGHQLEWTLAVFNEKRGEVTVEEIDQRFASSVFQKVERQALIENFKFLGRQNGFYTLLSIEDGATETDLVAVLRTSNLDLVELGIKTEGGDKGKLTSLSFKPTERRPKGSGFGN
jgi:hypothetical protein